jgi:hypothetical protein
MRKPALIVLALAALLSAEEPRFTPDNQMLRPEGYRQWVHVGSSLGMSYSEGAKPEKKNFHSVYLHPAAWTAYQKTGKFPEGTVLMMEIYSAGEQESINRAGAFANEFLRVEGAVKDSRRFDGGWAYFDFGGPVTGGLKDVSTAFAKERCWACHNEHAETDNVFTQFYPWLGPKK